MYLHNKMRSTTTTNSRLNGCRVIARSPWDPILSLLHFSMNISWRLLIACLDFLVPWSVICWFSTWTIPSNFIIPYIITWLCTFSSGFFSCHLTIIGSLVCNLLSVGTCTLYIIIPRVCVISTSIPTNKWSPIPGKYFVAPNILIITVISVHMVLIGCDPLLCVSGDVSWSLKNTYYFIIIRYSEETIPFF